MFVHRGRSIPVSGSRSLSNLLIPVLSRGGGCPSQVLGQGYLHSHPSPPPSLPRQHTPSTEYAASSMLLAIRQEDFLVVSGIICPWHRLSLLPPNNNVLLNNPFYIVCDNYDFFFWQKDRFNSETVTQMTSLKENLVLLNNIKQYAEKEIIHRVDDVSAILVRNKHGVTVKDERNYQQIVKSVAEHIELAEWLPRNYEHTEYTGKKNRDHRVDDVTAILVRNKHRV